MSEYKLIFWILIAVIAFIAFGLWLAEVLSKSESQKRMQQTERDVEKLIKQAQSKLDKRERLDTKWGEL